MSYLKIIGNALTVIGIVLSMRESHLKENKQIYTNAIVRSIIGMCSYATLGAFVGVANQFIVCIRSICLKEKEMSFKIMVGFQIIFTIMCFAMMTDYYGIVSWISGLFGTYSYYVLQTSKKEYRITKVVSILTGIVYALVIQNYVAVVYNVYNLSVHTWYAIREVLKERRNDNLKATEQI